MAGLLDAIAKKLLGVSGQKTAQRTVYSSVKPVVRKPETVEHTASVANEWVKNSTISESIDRTIKREREQVEVAKEDLLLTQIDEFRDKAKQLQELLLSKESKVIELQSIVDEREGKAKELEYILNERQRKADGITEEVSKQIDGLIEKVSAKMDEIGLTIGKDLENGQKLNEQQVEELKATLSEITEQLDTVKADLSEKVHSENVKCYRNISDLFKSTEEKLEKLDKLETMEQNIISVRKCTKAIIVLTIINMLGLTAFALYELGVFHMLLAMLG